MVAPRMAALLATMLFAAVGRADASATRPSDPLAEPWLVPVQDVPDVVRLLAERARRAERRGDTETAAELYATIRDLGYVIRWQEAPAIGSTSDDDGADRAGEGGRERDREDRDDDRDDGDRGDDDRDEDGDRDDDDRDDDDDD